MRAEQAQADDAHWRDEANWHLWHTIYWSRRDSRLAVPKWHEPKLGMTLNFARPITWTIFVFLLAPVAAMLFAVTRSG